MSTWAKAVQGEDVPDDNDNSELIDQIKKAGMQSRGEDPNYMSQLRDLAATSAQSAAQEAPAMAQAPVASEPNEDQLQDYLKKQGGGIDSMQQLADLYKQQLADQGNRPDLTYHNKLMDYYWGTNFSKDYKKPPTPAEQTEALMRAQHTVNQERQPMTADLLKQYGIDTSAVGKEESNYYKTMAQIQRNIAGQKATGLTDEMGQPIILDKAGQKLAKDMHDSIFLGRSANSQVQQSIAKLRNGVQFENMLAALPNGKVTPQDMAELVSAEGQTVTGQNILTDHRFSALYPSNMPLSMANVSQWLTGKPDGKDQKEWVNRMLNVVRSEKAGAGKTVNSWVDAQGKYYTAAGLHPSFVRAGTKSAKEFYNTAYEPVAGVGGFTGSRQSTAPQVPAGMKLQQNKKTGETRLVPQ